MADTSGVDAGNIANSIVIAGDDNRAYLQIGEAARLGLRRPHVDPPASCTELDVLKAHSARIAFVGREQELADLEHWLAEPAPISVHALIGRAGAGKTRLAIELCRRMEAGGPKTGGPEAEGWACGFLPAETVEPAAKHLQTWPLPFACNTLLVVDNAAAARAYLARFIGALKRGMLESGKAEPGKAKLRLLLLEREASAEFGWWRDLAGGAISEDDYLRELLRFRGRPPAPLAPLDDLAQRRALAQSALTEAAKLRATPPPPFPAPGADAEFDAMLAEPRFGAPLVLAMAGLVMLDRPPREALHLRRLDAARAIAQRELDRLARMRPAAEKDAVRRAAAFNLLAGGLDVKGLTLALGEMLTAEGLTGEAAALAELLQAEYPPADDVPDWLSLPRPHLIGEAMIVEALESGTPERKAAAGDLTARAFARTGERSAQALIRLAQDFAYPLEEGGAVAAVLGWLDAVSEQAEDLESVVVLVDALPRNTLALRDFAAALHKRLTDVRRASWRADPENEAQAAILAISLNNLANRLSDLGRREAALEAGQEAVELYCKLSAARPDAFTPDLATSLNNLANFLSDLGQREAALEAAQEAVELYRKLAAARPDAFTPDLAGSLSNLGNRLSDLGRREASLEASQEAVDLYRKLAAARPDAFTPDLAMSLNNLANSLSDLGRREASLEAAQEAVDLRRKLAAARSDAFTPDLAMSLNNLALRLSDLGQREAALEAAQEAVELYRKLAAARPDAFTPNLAGSLNNLANFLSDLGRREAALEAAQEAVELRRKLAAARPDAFTPDLATSLNNLAIRLSDLGRREAALEAAQEAVEHYRKLAAARSDAFTPDLAMSLNNLAIRLSDLGRREAALEAAQEAVEHYRKLSAARPDAFTPDLAMSLNNLANSLSDLGRREAALEAAREAAELYRKLAAARPDAFTPDLAGSLNNLANRLSDLGRREAALEAAQEAVEFRRKLAAARPDAFTPDLAASLTNLALRFSDLGQREAALEAAREAVALLSPYFLALPAAHSRRMAIVRRVYLEACEAVNREPDLDLLAPLVPVFERLQQESA